MRDTYDTLLINNFNRIKKIILAFIAITILFTSCANEKEQERPNILFVLVDDMGWRDLACYGHEIHETPNIDRLASQGMRFTQAYAACPICGPSRAAIMTGKFPSRTGFVDNFIDRPKGIRQFMPLEEFTLAEAFQKNGYQTAFVGKWHLSASDSVRLPTDQGFDVNVAGGWKGHPRDGFFSPYQLAYLTNGTEGEYLTDRLTTEAIQTMDNFSNKQKPWLMYLSYYTVHAPFHSKQEKTKKYKEKADKANLKINAAYAGMVESLDENVGRIFQWLEEKGLQENTIVVFTSDNGGFHKATHNRPLRGYKGELYEGGIREPLIVRWPGVIRPGSVCDIPVHGTDFYPTLLDMTELPLHPEQHQDGVSLVPLLKGEKDFSRGTMIWHYPVSLPRHNSIPGSVIREGNWKYIYYYDDAREELYNLKNDIGETNNLIETMREKAEEMKKKLNQKLKEHGTNVSIL